MDDALAPQPVRPVVRVLGLLVVVLLAVELTLYGAFLVPVHAGTVPLPVGPVIAFVSNLVLGVAAGRLLSGATAVPGAVWLVLALVLGSKVDGAGLHTDVVLTSSGMSYAYLLAGAVGAVLAFAGGRRRASPGWRRRR